MISVNTHYQISSHTPEAEGLYSVKMPQHLQEPKIVLATYINHQIK